MIKTKLFTSIQKPNEEEKNKLINFLYVNLEEYKDPIPDIEMAFDYALKEIPSFGGFVLISHIKDEITGAVVVNQTGMKDYIPENILVYIAVNKNHRGKGIGKYLIKKTIDLAKGSIALHVEPENPAKFLYKSVGFSSKYMEMRYIKTK